MPDTVLCHAALDDVMMFPTRTLGPAKGMATSSYRAALPTACRPRFRLAERVRVPDPPLSPPWTNVRPASVATA